MFKKGFHDMDSQESVGAGHENFVTGSDSRHLIPEVIS